MSLHLLPAGREMAFPLLVTEAVNLAVFNRMSMDAQVYYSEATGDIKVVSPWKSDEDALHAMVLRSQCIKVLSDNLSAGLLYAYVLHPGHGEYLRIDRRFWFNHELDAETMPELVGATGWDSSLVGQPIMVSKDDLVIWRACVQPVKDALQAATQPEPEPEQPKARPRKKGWTNDKPYVSQLYRLFKWRHADFEGVATNTGLRDRVHELWFLLKTSDKPPKDERIIRKRWDQYIAQQDVSA